MDITLRSGLDVVELIRLTGKFLFFTSTSEVYGRNPKVPWSEDDDRVLGSTDIDRWCYSSAKATLEHYIRACHLDEQLNYLNIRVFNCYGPRLRDRVVDRFVDAALRQEPLHIHGDGSHTRCFTYVDDLIDGTLQLLDTPALTIGSTTSETPWKHPSWNWRKPSTESRVNRRISFVSPLTRWPWVSGMKTFHAEFLTVAASSLPWVGKRPQP